MARARVLTAPILAALATLFVSPEAAADPQLNAGLLIGAAGLGYDKGVWQQTDFLFGVRADAIFGRTKNQDFGVGPYAEFSTFAFQEAHFGGGASLVIPALDSLPFVLSAGGFGKSGGPGGLEGGVGGDLFFGSKSYNFHGPWVLTGGLVGGFQRSLGTSHETTLTIGARLDLVVIALPFVFLINGLRSGSADVAPVR